MKKFAATTTPLFACVAAIALASPASAARTLCTDGPGIDLTTQACVWSPGAPGNDDEASVELAIFEATGFNIDLALYGKSDENLVLFGFTPGGDPENLLTVDWSVLDNTLIKYVTVKAANEFKVFEIAGLGASSGTADTLDLFAAGGGGPNGPPRPGISHISFWTAATPMPEPGTWAMMILGFGAVGGAMRSARKNRATLTLG